MIWYSDEEVCHSRKYSKGLFWIQKQKDVARKVVSVNTYFTLQMLKKDFAITKAMLGCDPDSLLPFDQEIKKWLRSHPAKIKKKKPTRKSTARKT